jgi:hypothetical protein
VSVYVYAISDAEHPLRLSDLKGVGEPGGSLRAVRGTTLTAVVSDAPAELRAKRRDLLAHQRVLERLMEDGSVLPMRFGLAAPDEDTVTAALDDNADTYTAQLRRITGCVEYNLKVARDREDLLREIVEDSEEVRRLNEYTRTHPDAREDKVALGELVSQEVSRRGEKVAAEVVDHLAPGAVAHIVGEEAEDWFLNVSFLVERGNGAAFQQAVESEGRRRGTGFSFVLNGPLPPYSFV